MPSFDPTGAEIRLGPRSWGTRPGTRGAILHTTEYPTAGRADAERCIADQSKRTATGGWAQPGSYGWILYDGGAFLSVPYLEGAGGINPASSAWAPDRYPWLRQLLGAEAYADPTMWHLQLAISGRAVDLLAALQLGRSWMHRIIDNAARIITWAELQPWAADNLVVSGHLHWQANRSDPGQPIIDAIVARCLELSRADQTPAPAPTPPPDYRALYEAEVAKVTDLVGKLRDERARVAARDAHIDAYPRT